MQAAHIRAAYTTENKPWITQSAAYVSHELGIYTTMTGTKRSFAA